MASNTDFSRIFNRLCHVAALTREGKTRAAVDSLVATVLALDPAFTPLTALNIRDAINSTFGLTFPEATLQASIDRKLSSRQLVRDRATKVLRLEPIVRADVEAQIRAAELLETQVRDEWFASVQTDGPLSSIEKAELWSGLRSYMAKAFQRHGVETILLLDPSQPLSEESKENLSTYLEESVTSCCHELPRDRAITCIPHFFINSTPLRTRYIAQLLDGTFTYFALTIDDATSNYLKEGITPISLFLDTNFIFAFLNLHTSPLNDVSRELIEIVREHKLPFKIYFHEETLLELRRTIGSIADGLKGRHWTQALSRAAIQSGMVTGLEQKYHELNAESPLDSEIFFSKYEHIEELLKEQGFRIYRTGSSLELDEQRYLLVAEYKNFMDTHRPARPKGYAALNHDIAVWQTVKSIQKKGDSVFEAGAFLLTTDFYFYKYDLHHLRDRKGIGAVMLSNQFLQLLRPFVPTSGTSNQHFIEVFAIPEFRTAVSDYASTGHKVLSYLTSYSDVSEQTAIRMLSNEVLMRQVKDVDEESKQFQELIDNALAKDNEELITRAQAASEEAQRAIDEAKRIKIEFQLKEQELLTERDKALVAEQKTNEARHLLEETRTEAVAKNKISTVAIDEMRSRLDRYERIMRLSAGLAIPILGITATLFLPWYFSWAWLRNHGHKWGLYGCTILLLMTTSWAIVDPRRRKFATLGTIALAAIVVILQII